jgi:hypothetical protein
MLPRSAIQSRHRNAPRPAWKVADAFGQWLRGRPCACGGRNKLCGGRIQAAHVPHKASKGIGTKAADKWMIPLSENCHLHTQHKRGWQTFAAEYLGGRDPVELAAEYWRAWPGRAKWEARNGA